MTPKTPTLAVLLATLSVSFSGCGENAPNSEAAKARGSTPEIASAPVDGPCGLLTMAEVRAVFPEATQTKAEDSLKDQGIRACDWESAAGVRLVQVRVSESSVDDEIGLFEAGVMDPTKSNKLTREPIAGSDGGQVIVAQQDAAAGVLQSVAVAAIQKGDQTVDVISSSISSRDRAAAATALGQLAKAATARLQ